MLLRNELSPVVFAGTLKLEFSTRPQMVTREANPRYYALIEEFGKLTGTPILLNTSFNLKGEPIVRTALDAVRTFFSSGIDLLVLQNYLVYKDGLRA